MCRASARLRHEAAGTSRLKILMDGPRAIATRDGATIEMAQEAGEAT
jgi:glycogen phosphorylase